MTAPPPQPMHFTPTADFKARSAEVVADPQLRASFRTAMDFLMGKRAAQLPQVEDFELQRDLCRDIRQYSLANLPRLLELLERNLQARGVKVHWARTPEEANQIFVDIAGRFAPTTLIKGKSMVSEEVELNHTLAPQGLNCLETDMGEYIVQLAGERPSHIIMPAIHKTKADIARLFEEKIPGTAYTEDVDELIAIGRRVLRTEFRNATVGVSGVNFLVADTGTLVLVENEGNGRMCTTAPDVHIAITGIEKVVETLDHVVPLYALLTRSATGQAISTYLNMITGPRRAGEFDGPREVHLVLLDNGRSQAYRNEALHATLRCIRCGACMNHCPVYARIGGLAYGTTYPGPIGSIISPHMLGLEATKEQITASSLCGACSEVCPVGIPIPSQFIRLREVAKSEPPASGPVLAGQGAALDWREKFAWTAWSRIYASPSLYRLFAWCATRFRALTPPWQGGWTAHRTPLRPAVRSLREQLAERRKT